MVISVNRRLFRYFGSYSGISVIPVILVNRRTLNHPPLFMNNIPLKCKSTHKHLGLTFSDTCDWTNHITNIQMLHGLDLTSYIPLNLKSIGVRSKKSILHS